MPLGGQCEFVWVFLPPLAGLILDCCRCYFYLSTIDRKRGDIHLARTHMQRCLEIREKHMPHHHHTGFTHHQMGLLMQMSGDDEEAV